MGIALGVKTEFELKKSLIKIPDLINYLKSNNYPGCGIIDEYLFSSVPLIKAFQKENLIPVIGLPITINDQLIYLFAKNNNGFKNLLKLNTIKQERTVTSADLTLYHDSLILVLPYSSKNINIDLSLFTEVFNSYENDAEKKLVKHPKIFLKPIRYFNDNDIKYMEYLSKIDETETYPNASFTIDQDDDSEKLLSLINLSIDDDKRYIPQYKKDVDSNALLKQLALKGLNKRLNNQVSDSYAKRLEYELEVIKNMNFSDYFLIVYDYVLYAKKNDIIVGPGRGSGAGSLVCFSLGITEIDPLKYNLLFERFLNKERITMPDIDIDFEYSRREEVIDYVRERYGNKNTGNIITYSTLKSKVLLKELGKIMAFDEAEYNRFLKIIDADLSIKENFNKPLIKNNYGHNKKYQELYDVALHLENLKNFTSVHAAGVVISSVPMDEIIPLYYDGKNYLTGVTMDYLEEMGLLKMDFLALKNLSVIKDIMIDLKNHGNNFDLNDIPLNDKATLKLFYDADTLGIFQFESSGMLNFLRKLKVTSFKDIYDALALFRPGPMDNINNYIKNKTTGKISYLDKALEPILKDTYGIIVYQEQIMEIMVKLANYSYSEADLVRRAMSKKKKEILEKEETKFINGCSNNGISELTAKKIFALVLKFASYGFNKSHSVSYAMISYKQAYLKAHYKTVYLKYLLNESLGATELTKKYIDYAKNKNITFIKPDINLSQMTYELKGNEIIMPFSIIRGISSKVFESIINNRGHGYKDIFDFISKNNDIKDKTFIALVKSGIFDSFGINKKTLIENADAILNFGMLGSDLGFELERPLLENKEDYNQNELIEIELNSFGFLVRDHQVSKYNQKEYIKVNNIANYFNKEIKNVFLVEDVKKTKTKNNDDMLIVNVSDETGSLTLFLFKPLIDNLIITKNDIISVIGIVTKRYNEYQISVKSIKKID